MSVGSVSRNLKLLFLFTYLWTHISARADVGHGRQVEACGRVLRDLPQDLASPFCSSHNGPQKTSTVTRTRFPTQTITTTTITAGSCEVSTTVESPINPTLPPAPPTNSITTPPIYLTTVTTTV
ncbi:hypothetical protein CC80DRAFT_533425 [Byssothecium circinans]|uniref:Uncharacterized protein n=1 Tax=Byssothecium circinans TaxID=147558 RepID=A0A6A5U3J9_9PLEO|nr:hypothetical protein CC80DRAFT_533425 [Byssothecium circinans]